MFSSNDKTKLLYVATVALSSLVVLPSCGSKVTSALESITQSESSSGSNAGVSKLAVDVNRYASSKLVCNPFDGPTTQTNYQKGIKAELYYARAGAPRLYLSTDYIQFGQKSEQNLFLNDVNVPTRLFTEGFANASGSVLQDDSGNKLIEFFGLKMNTNLVLTDADSEGDYELAMIADDGSTLKIKSGDADMADETIVSNDGDHPTRMGCATRTIKLRKNVMLPIEMTYYQGPRTQIANVLVWRKASEAGKDSSCGMTSNEAFWDYNNHSAPNQNFKNLEARGWKIVAPDNFVVSSTKVDYNPCVAGTNPVISGLEVGEVILTTVILRWNTDIPATAQVELTNVSTGTVTTTTSDNVLRTVNEVTLDGLQPATVYKARIISVSADLGRTMSDELTFQTQ